MAGLQVGCRLPRTSQGNYLHARASFVFFFFRAELVVRPVPHPLSPQPAAGPVFYKGRYHMFYQHLPNACEWGFGIVSGVQKDGECGWVGLASSRPSVGQEGCWFVQKDKACEWGFGVVSRLVGCSRAGGVAGISMPVC